MVNKIKNEYGFNLLKMDLPLLPTNEEEKELFKRSDMSSKKKLVEKNLRLVIHIANKFKNLYIEFEDLVSIGTIGLIKAVDSFNPNKGKKFSMYASICIENEILLYNRKYMKKYLEVSTNQSIGTNKDGKELKLENVIYNKNNDDINFAITKQCIVEFMQTLDEREKKFMKLRYLQGLTQKQISAELNIVQSRISTLQRNILKNLKEYIA